MQNKRGALPTWLSAAGDAALGSAALPWPALAVPAGTAAALAGCGPIKPAHAQAEWRVGTAQLWWPTFCNGRQASAACRA